MEKIKNRLKEIYGKDYEKIFKRLKRIIGKYKKNKVIINKKKMARGKKFSEKDAILITYGDSIIKEGEKPLVSLNKFLKKNVGRSVSGVHILPFFPYSSDDGFSVIDYREVDSRLGSWEDIHKIGKGYRLMADLVVNHISAKSEWFEGFLKGDKKYKDYFISYKKEVDTSQVFRPRVSPLLTKFETSWGDRYVWTTFSEDQIDLNFSNPDVFLEMIDIMLYYVSNYVEIIRLDAIGFLWKELGTNCFHLKKTHEMVKLFHDILDEVASYVVLVTETNVPYNDNISYFGNKDEADMVYQFSYPPLVLDSFLRGDSRYLQKLFKKLSKVDNENLFFNFLASHDGIGVLSSKEYLSDDEFEGMLEGVKEHGGYVSYKNTEDGEVAYEMNINYFDGINNPILVNGFGEDENNGSGTQDSKMDVNGKEINKVKVDVKKEVKKFMASQAIIALSKGVPGIYIHSFLGSRNYNEGVKESGIKRRVNREKLDFDKLIRELNDKDGRRSKVLEGYKELLRIRSDSKSFDPYLKEEVVESDKRLLVLKKEDGKIVVINVSDEEVELEEFDRKGKIERYGVKVIDSK